MFGDPCQHACSKLFVVVEGEHDVGSALAFQNPVRPGLALDVAGGALPARVLPWSPASDSRGLEQTVQLDSRLAVLQPLDQHP
jgi:hypothetical protein